MSLDLPTLWFSIVALLLALYVVFDGVTLGAGICHMFVARIHDERLLIRRSVGPGWRRHELWLLAAAGTLFYAFPAAYERAVDEFNAPLIVLAAFVVLRGVGLACARSVESPFASRMFGYASIWLAFLLGVALGNAVRGAPVAAAVVPLWTDFGVRGQIGLFDWYTVLVGVTATAVVTMHGALWIVMRTDGDIHDLARETAARLWAPIGLLVAGMTWATFEIQPHIPEQFIANPWGLGFPALSVAAFLGIRRRAREGRERPTFGLSCVFVFGLVMSATFGLYPYVLPSVPLDPALALHAYGDAAPVEDLASGLYWWVPGLILVAAYVAIVHRRTAGKVTLDDAR